MFWRYLPDSGSPAPRPSQDPEVTRGHIWKATGAWMISWRSFFKKCDKNDLLMIVSDHGFNAFNRGFHLNTWLHREGYLVLKTAKRPAANGTPTSTGADRGPLARD